MTPEQRTPLDELREIARTPRQCDRCGESESSNPAWSGLHRYGPTTHDFDCTTSDLAAWGREIDSPTVRAAIEYMRGE